MKTATVIHLIPFLQRLLSLNNHDRQGVERGPLLNRDENGFTMIEINISLTWQLPNVISVIIPELWLHLRICSLGKFVIFYDIKGFQRRGFLQIISETVEKVRFWHIYKFRI